MREKVFLAHPRFFRTLLCVFTFLEDMYSIPTVRHAGKHTPVTGDMPFPVLVDTKFWDAIKYCCVVPALVQDICVVPPFPADPAALVLGPVLKSFSPMMKTTPRGRAAGLETPPGPSRVWDTLPQHNPFPSLLPPLGSAAQKGSYLLTCTVTLEFSSEISEAELGLHFPRLDGREPLAQFPGPRCSLATAAPNRNTSMSGLGTLKWIFCFSPYLCPKDFLSRICHFGLLSFRWHCYHFQEGSLLAT